MEILGFQPAFCLTLAISSYRLPLIYKDKYEHILILLVVCTLAVFVDVETLLLNASANSHADSVVYQHI